MAGKDGIERIMVPLDGSKLAESVLPLAASIAGHLGAKLLLLHIVEQNPPQLRHGEPHLRTAQQAESYLATLKDRYSAQVEIEMHVHGVEENNVAQGIAEHVGELGVGMVALCTHGRSDIRRVMWGSIAQLVLRRVHVPVLIVRPKEPPQSEIGSILVTLDAEHTSDEALDIASKIAAACDVPLKLLSVVPTAETLTGDRMAAARLIPISTSAALDVEQQAASEYLQEKANQLRSRGLEVEMAVRRGEVTPTLAEAAKGDGDALVVISTHGRAGLDAALSGSVAQRVMGLTSQPVLLIKIP